MQIQTPPPLDNVLAKLPWFTDLTWDHREHMIEDVSERLISDTTRDQFTDLLLYWAGIAHDDLKWSRLRMLRESGTLVPSVD